LSLFIGPYPKILGVELNYYSVWNDQKYIFAKSVESFFMSDYWKFVSVNFVISSFSFFLSFSRKKWNETEMIDWRPKRFVACFKHLEGQNETEKWKLKNEKLKNQKEILNKNESMQCHDKNKDKKKWPFLIFFFYYSIQKKVFPALTKTCLYHHPGRPRIIFRTFDSYTFWKETIWFLQ
jgi:hypothetical protein